MSDDIDTWEAGRGGSFARGRTLPVVGCCCWGGWGARESFARAKPVAGTDGGVGGMLGGYCGGGGGAPWIAASGNSSLLLGQA